MNLVIVESPAKAKTINKYLGAEYTVLASYGHIRDLPSKDGSVQPGDDFAMVWESDARSQKHVREIIQAAKKADHLFLATDPDREGEAIAWHVLEVLNKGKALNGVDVKRVVFNEITKSAILDAFSHPRDIDGEMVNAYLARRALDYLVGFTLSPVLWRKLPGSRSAGRVQSVALRLICEREDEIDIFVPREYWSVRADFDTGAGVMVNAALTHLDGKKLDKWALPDEAAAQAAVGAIRSGAFSVAAVEKKQTKRHPAAPFTTSTLQQEASRKLGFSAKRTMQTAQRLYEGASIGGETVGLITYMRTDGVQMAAEALTACRALIARDFGEAYLPDAPRVYKSKAKNAQEAHEAVRPTDLTRLPKAVAAFLDEDQRRLYELIWKRTVASQMESVVLDQVAVDIASGPREIVLRATGSIIAFDGFYRLYHEGRDETTGDAESNGNDEKERILPEMAVGQALACKTVLPQQHFTQPPPRYSEASLVRKLEELGIGRPSTYASIISVLQERNYVRLEQRRFIPEDRGRVVTAFLTNFFKRYMEYNFTADLEDKLDDISGGRADWKQVLRDFWTAFSASVEDIGQLRVREVLDALNDLLAPHFFPQKDDGKDPRTCPTCADGQLSLKLGKFGAFIGCSNYPECRFTRPLTSAGDDQNDMPELEAGPKLLGVDPVSGLDVTLRKGPYGIYVQLGEQVEGEKKRPKRASLAKGESPAQVDLEKALGLLALPRDVGEHPETGKMIQAGLGRFGPYLSYNNMFISLKGDDDPLTIGINRAVTVIAESGKTPPVELGKHPKDKKPVTVRKGRWGPFVQHGRTKANLPKSTAEEDVTLEMALELLAKGDKGKGAAKTPKKAPKKAVKKTTKKAPAKKAPAKKKTAPKKAAEA
ncbi:type I DNA topoisomerase [Varunaivibrio sulfuroxidans]|uniref:DNA topoisomerase 1 n=1 Tax=Varunaivibrio sulfuroxidans TaxID=1773489 RepID=A0A4R3JAD2_9PROT|nr:type I DNA topoisomerase [Varunaivibrio sulfuroxidans]TCS62504.1 DNA topoisomerase I [Varunaivibrio sulfuroxidans]WES30825.1 type I DNA topoisomerase [Varunaivibrio sulfuroxidans]